MSYTSICEACPEISGGSIVLSHKATIHLLSLLQRVRGEFGFKLVGYRRNKREVRIIDIYVPRQEAGSAHFEFSSEGNMDVAQAMLKGLKFVGWGHSHAGMNAFHSGTDLATDERSVSMAKLPIASLTVNNNSLKWDGLLYHRLSCGRVAKIQASVKFPFDFSGDLAKLASHNGRSVPVFD